MASVSVLLAPPGLSGRYRTVGSDPVGTEGTGRIQSDLDL